MTANFKDQFKNISDSLNANFDAHLPVKAENEITIKQTGEEKVDADYVQVRKNLYDLIETGKDAVANILDVAKAGDSPRAYEVVSQMLKTVSEMNKDVLEVHDKVKKIKEDKYSLTQKNTTNNTIYVGSTSELQDLINPDRSSGKDIKKV
jgi:hypothetical protein|tara:strand:- start:365 stop:814 length:450 start_codon:yes stop_codon:yes gene_type:complete